MSQHTVISMTDNTRQAVCGLSLEKIMVLIVWHRLNGDKSLFRRVFEMARRAEQDENHPCNACRTMLYALGNDPEFRALAVKEQLLAKEEAEAMLKGKIV